ncbi:MAG: tRNA lysidine(34) synthetase TilS [Candidatus Omnitrophota bacterium]
MDIFIQKVKESALHNKLFSNGDRALVAVSGGPDSVALLHALSQLRYALGIQLVVGHVDHHLRATSSKDASFVKKLSKELNIPCEVVSVKIQKSWRASSVEELARQARFNALVRLAKKHKMNTIALGHTQNDLAETVLMRILRGSGLLGMQSILPKRVLYNTVFVRPLLHMTRAEIDKFLQKNRYAFRLDPTNKQKLFFRNKIRLELLPLLQKKFNPGIQKTLTGLAETSAIDYSYLEEQAQKELRKISGEDPKKIPLEKFNKLHLSLQRMIIRLCIQQKAGNTRQITLDHIREVEKLIASRGKNARIRFPNGLRVTKEGAFLVFK